MALKNHDEISMQEILESIREYVSPQDHHPSQSKSSGKVIKLTEDYVEDNDEKIPAIGRVANIESVRPSPFSKLQEAKKKHEKDNVIMQCLRDIVFEWMDSRPDFVEKAIHKAIQKQLED